MANERGRVRVEDSGKRVRVLFGGVFVADSVRVRLVWESPHYPTYYFPESDVRTDLLNAAGATRRSPSRGEAQVHDLVVGDAIGRSAALRYAGSPLPALVGTVRFDWNAMDAWFEEDEEVYVHARDPYKRVDVLQSSRHVRVVIDGERVAETVQPRLLFETGLPTRYYLPKTDVRLDLLEASDHHTRCPYKGTASYYSVRVGDTNHRDIAWWYPHPTLECAKVAGYVAFYNELVDTYVDDELQEGRGSPLG